MIRRCVVHLILAAVVLGLGSGPVSSQTPPNARDLRIYAGLHAAAASGDVAEIERLIADGERIDIQDANSRTPLHVAVFLKRHAAARALIRLGANPNALDAQRYDVATIAAVQNDLDMLKIVLDGGGSARNITSPYDSTALIAAAHLGHAEVVRALIAHKAPLDHINGRGWTALIEAVVLGNGGPNHVATVEALVNAGADSDIKDRHGATALSHARRRGYSDMVRILEPARGRRT
jgi:ankyrin repeat protein